jgi:hypothetical protein
VGTLDVLHQRADAPFTTPTRRFDGVLQHRVSFRAINGPEMVTRAERQPVDMSSIVSR